jgi:hypothetical protein
VAVTVLRPPILPGVSEHPAKQLTRWRMTQAAIAVSVAAMPLLRPSGPGNTGLVDLALLTAIVAAALWASTRSLRVRLPYALPVGLMVVAGASTVVTIGQDAAEHAILALVQDVFVFGWAAAVATIGRDRGLLDGFCRAWAFSGTAWAGALILGEILGLNWLTGINAADGLRASLTFGDPNLAANYFLCTLLVIRATQRPRKPALRWLACGLTGTGVVLTLSNGGILAMLIATVLGGLFALASRRGVIAAATLGGIIALGAGVLLYTVDVHATVTRAEEASPFAHDSIGREGESGASRVMLAQEGLRLLLRNETPLGLGPGNTEAALRAQQAPYVKEAHDDYLAAVVERGVLGGVAIVLLMASVTVRSRRIAARRAVPPDYLAVVARPELLVAAVIAIGVSGLFYEVLHFRHVWALLGLIAALELSGRRS